MKTEQKLERVKINLSLDKDFFEKIKEQADLEYLKVSTWTKRFLMMNLSDTNNKTKKILTKDEKK